MTSTPRARKTRESAEKLRAALHRLERLVNRGPAVLYSCAPTEEMPCTFLSQSVRQQLGYEAEQFIADPQFWRSRLHPEDQPKVIAGLAALAERKRLTLEYRFQHADGSYRRIRDELTLVSDEAGNPLEVSGCRTDVTRPAEWTEEIRWLVEQIADFLPATVYLYDLGDQRNVFVNQAIEAVLGYSPAEIGRMGSRFLAELMHPKDFRRVPQMIRGLAASQPGQALENEFRMRHISGEYRWLHASEVVVSRTPEGAPRLVLGLAHDITARRRLQEQLTHNALHDPLTGLGNRSLLLEQLDHAVKRWRRQPEYQFGLLLLEVQHWKSLLEQFGEAAAERILCVAIGRLETALRAEDTLFRIGGTEFAILAEQLSKEEEAVYVAERALEQFREPFSEANVEAYLSASIGISMSQSGYESLNEMWRDAAIALHRAKAAGGGCFRLFDARMHARVRAQLELEAELRQALAREEFELYYQPIWTLEPVALRGMETLLRWRHPERGILLPETFLAETEEAGLSVRLAWWVLRAALRQLSEWRRLRLVAPEVFVSVNLAANQFSSPDLVRRIADLLGQEQLEASCLRLEMTETVLMKNADAVAGQLSELNQLGVGLMLDDFGTGYSSLSRLSQFPIQAVKIDRSFVSGLQSGTNQVQIVRAIIDLARDLKMEVIAEGIETLSQADLLRQLGCDLGQGNYFREPLPSSDSDRLFLTAGM